MKTSSTRASTFAIAITGGILTLASFAMLLDEVGRDFDWANANIAPYVFFIVLGILLIATGPYIGSAVGNTDDELERETYSTDDTEGSGSFGDGFGSDD